MQNTSQSANIQGTLGDNYIKKEKDFVQKLEAIFLYFPQIMTLWLTKGSQSEEFSAAYPTIYRIHILIARIPVCQNDQV